VPNVDAVVIPVGGAGLIAGAALALKTLNPHVTVIGAEPASVPSFTAALEAGRPVDVKAGATLADGLLVPRVGTNAFALARKHVDKVRRRVLRRLPAGRPTRGVAPPRVVAAAAPAACLPRLSLLGVGGAVTFSFARAPAGGDRV
jgi:hypothetical protein